MWHKYSLQTFVHRTLAYRLLILGLALSLIIGLAVLFTERDKISQEVIDIVLNDISLFINRYDYLLADPSAIDPGKIHQAAMEFGTSQAHSKLGSFVTMTIYDARGKIVTELFDKHSDNLGKIKNIQQKTNIKLAAEDRNHYKILLISGRPYLRIVLPFENKNRQMLGSIDTFFTFSDATMEASRLRGLRAVTIAIIIVLLTTATLYPVVMGLTRRVTQFSEQLLKANVDTLETLGNAIALRDSNTNAHNYRVTIYASRLGEEVGLHHQLMRTLIKGSFLHDVGKIGIPDSILLKPGQLTDKEIKIMRGHVELGRRIIQRSAWLNDAQDIILSHHEKLSGNGYPRGVSGEDIPLTGRIFAIADVFDALTSKRPYKEAWSFEQAMETINKGRGSHFDPLILDAFNRIAGPLYETFGEKEELYQQELDEIIKKYFYEGVGGVNF